MLNSNQDFNHADDPLNKTRSVKDLRSMFNNKSFDVQKFTSSLRTRPVNSVSYSRRRNQIKNSCSQAAGSSAASHHTSCTDSTGYINAPMPTGVVGKYNLPGSNLSKNFRHSSYNSIIRLAPEDLNLSERPEVVNRQEREAANQVPPENAVPKTIKQIKKDLKTQNIPEKLQKPDFKPSKPRIPLNTRYEEFNPKTLEASKHSGSGFRTKTPEKLNRVDGQLSSDTKVESSRQQDKINPFKSSSQSSIGSIEMQLNQNQNRSIEIVKPKASVLQPFPSEKSRKSSSLSTVKSEKSEKSSVSEKVSQTVKNLKQSIHEECDRLQTARSSLNLQQNSGLRSQTLPPNIHTEENSNSTSQEREDVFTSELNLNQMNPAVSKTNTFSLNLNQPATSPPKPGLGGVKKFNLTTGRSDVISPALINSGLPSNLPQTPQTFVQKNSSNQISHASLNNKASSEWNLASQARSTQINSLSNNASTPRMRSNYSANRERPKSEFYGRKNLNFNNSVKEKFWREISL